MSATQGVYGRAVRHRVRARSWIVPLAVAAAIGLIVAIVGLVSNGATSSLATRSARISTAPAVTVEPRGEFRDPVTHALLRVQGPASNPAVAIRSNRGAS